MLKNNLILYLSSLLYISRKYILKILKININIKNVI